MGCRHVSDEKYLCSGSGGKGDSQGRDFRDVIVAVATAN